MPFRQLCIFFQLILLPLASVKGQSFRAITFNEKDGLLSNHVYRLSQSSDGKLMAITRNGVCSFDGSEWVNIDDGRLPAGGNTRVRNTKDGSVWLAGFREKQFTIARYKNGQWQHLPVPPEIIREYSEYTIGFDLRLEEDGSFHLALAMGNHLLEANSKEGVWTTISCPSMKMPTGFHDIRYLNQDLFLLTPNGLWMHTGEKCVRLETPFPNNHFIRMEIDSTGEHCYFLGMGWLGICTNGIFETIDTTFRPMFYDRVSSASLFLSKDNRLFFGLNSNIYVLSRNRQRIRKLVTLGQMESLWHNSVFVDRENNVWICDNRGLAEIKNLGLQYYDHNFGLLEDEVSGAYEWTDGRIVLGSNYSIGMIEGDEAKILFQAPRKKDIVYRFSAFTEHGPYLYFHAFQKGIGRIRPDLTVEWVAPTPPGEVMVNSYFFSGDSLFVTSDDKTWLWKNGYHLWIDKQEYIRHSIKWKDETWYLSNSGIIVYRGKERRRHYRGASNSLNSVTDLLTTRNCILVATHGGVAEIKGDSIVPCEVFGVKINRPVFDLLETSDSSIWVGTDDGAYVIHPNGKMQHFDTENGLVGNEINRYTMFETSFGHVAIGTDQGLSVYSAEDESHSLQLPIPAIFVINTYDTSFHSPDAVIKAASNEDDLEITFGAITLGSSDQLTYRYRLAGHEEEWREHALGTRATVGYVNLNGGKYEFQLQVLTDQGWSEIKTSQTIEITARFYKQWWFRLGIFIAVLGVVILLIILIYQRKTIAQNQLVEQQHDTITRSIRYAQRIQTALLPSEETCKNTLPEHFIFYRPKDIVAGDFYWFEKIGDELLFALADCTGHGVPGAMVSVIGVNALNRAVKDYLLMEPVFILEKVREIVQESFGKSDLDMDDGMEMAIIRLNTKTLTLAYSGARLSLYRVTQKAEAPEAEISNDEHSLIEYKGNHISIGKLPSYMPFEQQQVQLLPGDRLYLSSDGFPDQFNHETGKKMMVKEMKKIFLSLHDLPSSQQKEELVSRFEEWKGAEMQLDDVCVVGFRV